jgi:hypothetical protein
MPETDILSNPGVSLSIGVFSALTLIALFRKARKLFIFGVFGLVLTIGLFVVKTGS